MRSTIPSSDPGDEAADRVRRFIAGRDVALTYGALVVLVAGALAFVSPAVADDVVRHSSTNLDNLRAHPPFVLVVSAFVDRIRVRWGMEGAWCDPIRTVSAEGLAM